MSARLDHLRAMRDFIDSEIAAELAGIVDNSRQFWDSPLVCAVTDLYGVTRDELASGTRRHRVTIARHGIAWLLHRRGRSYRDIAYLLGYGDHTAAAHACRRVEHDQATRTLLLGLEVAA